MSLEVTESPLVAQRPLPTDPVIAATALHIFAQLDASTQEIIARKRRELEQELMQVLTMAQENVRKSMKIMPSPAADKAVLIPMEDLPPVNSEKSSLEEPAPTESQDTVAVAAAPRASGKRKLQALASKGWTRLSNSVKRGLKWSLKQSLLLAAAGAAGAAVGASVGALAGTAIAPIALLGTGVGALTRVPPVRQLLGYTIKSIYYMCVDPVMSARMGFMWVFPYPSMTVGAMGRFAGCSLATLWIVGAFFKLEIGPTAEKAFNVTKSGIDNILAPYITAMVKWVLEVSGLQPYLENLALIRTAVESILAIVKDNLMAGVNVVKQAVSTAASFNAEVLRVGADKTSQAFKEYLLPTVSSYYQSLVSGMMETHQMLMGSAPDALAELAEAEVLAM